MKKHILSAILMAGLSAPALAENYSYYSYDDLYKTPAQSGHEEYLSMSLGSFTSDLDKKAAMISFGYQKNYASGLGYGVSLDHSLSSSITESDTAGDTELRYVALSPYISQEFNLIRMDRYKAMKGYVRVGGSVVKPEGNYAEANYDDYEMGVYYGAGILIPYADYASFALGIHRQEAIDVTDIKAGIRFSF